MITKLEIKNFKGIENATFDKIGLVNCIYGKNGSGKTSVLDCILWLLTGATLTFGDSNKVDDKCVCTNKPNQLINAKITIDDDTFERKYGHTISKLDEDKITDVNSFYYNDRLCKNQKEYYDAVARVLGIDKISTKEKVNVSYALMNPYVFGKEMKEETFRRFIMSIINVDFNDVIMSKSDKYDELKADFKKQGCDINNLTTYYKQQIKKENSSLIDYSNTIDTELEEDENVVKEEINKLIEEKARCNANYNFVPSVELTNMKNELNDLSKEINLSEQEDIIKNISEDEKKLNELVKKQRDRYNETVDKYSALAKDLEILKSKNYANNMKIVSLQESLLNLEKQSFTAIICPHCGKAINDKEQEEFINNNKIKIADIEKERDDLQNKSKELNDTILNKQELLDKITGDLKSLKMTYNENKQALQDMQSNVNKNVQSEKTKELRQKYDELISKIELRSEEEREQFTKTLEESQKKSSDISMEINKLQDKIKKIIENNQLKVQKKEHLNNKASLEYKLSLCKEYANELSSITNKYSKDIFGDDVEFVMLKKLKTTDEYKPVCYAQIKGIPYDSLNTANCLLTGIIIIEKIKKYVGTNDIPVIFDIIDNIGEDAYQNIINKSHSQIFYTKVDTDDKEDRQLIVKK